MKRVLYVCLGNTCCSPLAMAAATSRWRGRVDIDSAARQAEQVDLLPSEFEPCAPRAALSIDF
jgi:protein-tyrosine-phosphatase